MKVFTYRYFWKDKEGKLYVKFLTESEKAHQQFMDSVKNDENIVSCMREYVGEIDYAYLGFTEPVKEEKKEDNENEENCS